MTIFAVIPLPDPNSVKLAYVVPNVYPQRCYNLGNGSWLVADQNTAEGVTDKLGLKGADVQNGAALVVEVGSYYGRGNPAIWTWMVANWGAIVG